MKEVLESAQWVTAQSRAVSLDRRALQEGARTLAQMESKLSWDRQHHFFDGTDRTVQYFFVLDSLNFCFWPEPRWKFFYQGHWLDGYRALAAALKAAVTHGTPILEAVFLAEITETQLREVLAGENEVPLLKERVAVLREAGAVLRAQYGGQAARLVASAQRSAVRLAQKIVRDFPSFRDEAIYHGQRVYFYKRAQIFCADLSGAFGEKGWGEFSDIDELTAFADYKVPQVLRHLGSLRYSQELAAKVDRREELLAGSDEEIEIRAHTIWAVELLKRELAKLGRKLRSFEIDWLLWNLGQRDEFRQRPYHRTRTVYY